MTVITPSALHSDPSAPERLRRLSAAAVARWDARRVTLHTIDNATFLRLLERHAEDVALPSDCEPS